MNSCAKPRVIIYSDYLLAPSETFIHAQASALSEFEPVYAGSRRIPGLNLDGERIHILNPRENLWGKCRELRFKLTGFAPGFVERLGALRPALVHAHHGPNGLRALPIANRLKIPLIVTFHGSDVTVTDLRYQTATLGFRHYLANKRKLKSSQALFLAVSKFVRRKLLEQDFAQEKVLVHYTGVDTKKFRPASTELQPVILFVGRLEESKGVQFLIRAAAEVQTQLPSVELVVIGDGSLRAALEEDARQQLRGCRFLGVRTSEEVCEWMNRASLVCVPSVTRRSGEEEGFGMVCAEAQAVGKPVVAFDSGGISEIVSHGRTGFLVPERDWRALAESILLLMRNPELRKRFGMSGRELVLREFDLERCTKRLEGFYTRIMANNLDRKQEGVCRGAVVDYCA